MANALLPPDTSSYADPVGNALLAKGWDGTAAIQQAQGVQNIQRGQVALSQDQLKLGMQKLSALNDVIGAIGADPTLENAHSRILNAVETGAWTPDMGNAALTELSKTDGSPGAIRQLSVQHLATNADIAQKLQMMGGAPPQMVNVGGTLQPMVAQSGLTPSINSAGGGAVPVTMTPAEKVAAGKTVTNQDNSTTFLPGSQLYDDRGNFIGSGSAPSIPVYRGAGAASPPSAGTTSTTGRGAPAPISFGGTPADQPAAPAASPSPTGQGTAPAGRVPVGYPTSSGPGSGTQSNVPAPAGQGGGQAAPAGPPQMVTPSPQNLPVITQDQAAAAMENWKAGKASAVDRNVLRGFAVQNNQSIDKMGSFEAQPIGIGAAAPNVSGQANGGGMSGNQGQPATAPGAGSAPSGSPAGQPTTSGVGLPAPRQGGLTMSLSPGQQASLTAGSNGYAALSTDVSNQDGSPKRIFQLSRALDAIRNTTTGRGTAARQEMLGYLDALPGGIGKAFPGVDPASLTNYDLATKYTNAIAMSAPGAARSDAGLATATSANASTNGMTQQAAMDVITNNLGQERAKPALLMAFQKSGQDPGNFNRFATQWLQGTDPRAFALGDMTPQERASLYNGLSGSQRANFLQTVKKGLAAGVLRPADLQGAASNGQ